MKYHSVKPAILAVTFPAQWTAWHKSVVKPTRAALVALCTLILPAATTWAQSSGSGFFLNGNGLVATNFHVVDGASRIEVVTADGRRVQAAILRVDRANDLALLQAEQRGTSFLPLATSSGVRRGERVYAMGFPQTSIQGVEPKLTDGVVSSLSGIRDEPRTFQVTNPIQPGNSGGPLFSEDGQVVGVIVATLDASKVLAATGALPQNVNYAIKSNYLLELVASVGSIKLPVPQGPASSRSSRRLVDVVADVEKALVRVLADNRPLQAAARPKGAQASPSPSGPGEPLTVQIAHVAPLSGPQAHYGRDNENGARMAVAELNSRSVAVAGRQLHFELVSEDDAADPRRAAPIAERICAANAIAIVGHLNSATSIQAAPIYNRCGLAQITPSATNPNLTRRGFRTTFRLIASDLDLPIGLATFARERLGARKAVAVSEPNAYGVGTAEAFLAAARAQGLEAGERLTLQSPGAIVDDIERQRPDVVFFGGMDTSAGPLIRELRQRGINVKVLGADGICTRELAQLSGSKVDDGVICAEGGSGFDAMNGGHAWKRRYDAAFPGQFQVYSPYTYDAVMVIAQAITQAGSVDRAAIATAISNISYQGVTSRISFDTRGELRSAPLTLYTFRGGQKQRL